MSPTVRTRRSGPSAVSLASALAASRPQAPGRGGGITRWSGSEPLRTGIPGWEIRARTAIDLHESEVTPGIAAPSPSRLAAVQHVLHRQLDEMRVDPPLSRRTTSLSTASASPPRTPPPALVQRGHLGKSCGLAVSDPIAGPGHEVVGDVIWHPSVICPATGPGQAYTGRRVVSPRSPSGERCGPTVGRCGDLVDVVATGSAGPDGPLDRLDGADVHDRLAAGLADAVDAGPDFTDYPENRRGGRPGSAGAPRQAVISSPSSWNLSPFRSPRQTSMALRMQSLDN